jgi:RHS repeat-associated protein
LYRLTKEQVTDVVNGNRATEFSYDKVGNRQEQKVTANNLITTTAYQYDDNDRLLKEKENGSDKVIYTYDNNGNTLTKTENGETTESIWNDQNRLSGAKVKDINGSVIQQVDYEYDVSGIRVSQDVDGEITKYLIDANLPYAQAVVEYRPSGLVVVSYTHGNDLISQSRNGDSSFYHVDGLGSTRALSDGGGNLIDTYSYQAFGELLNSSGGSQNNYLFAGEQFDPVLGDYYNRARYYDPETGRFTRRDDYAGNVIEPISLHKYIYGNANPINSTDPSGKTTLNELNLGISWLNQLAVAATPSVGIGLIATATTTAIIIGLYAYTMFPELDEGGKWKLFPDDDVEKKKLKASLKKEDNDVPQMRVQFQEGIIHDFGIGIIGIPEIGVTKAQVFAGLWGLVTAGPTVATWYSWNNENLKSAFGRGIADVSNQIKKYNGDPLPGKYQFTSQWDNKGKPQKKGQYRVDCEQIRGDKNLKI